MLERIAYRTRPEDPEQARQALIELLEGHLLNVHVIVNQLDLNFGQGTTVSMAQAWWTYDGRRLTIRHQVALSSERDPYYTGET